MLILSTVSSKYLKRNKREGFNFWPIRKWLSENLDVFICEKSNGSYHVSLKVRQTINASTTKKKRNKVAGATGDNANDSTRVHVQNRVNSLFGTRKTIFPGSGKGVEKWADDVHDSGDTLVSSRACVGSTERYDDADTIIAKLNSINYGADAYTKEDVLEPKNSAMSFCENSAHDITVTTDCEHPDVHDSESEASSAQAWPYFVNHQKPVFNVRRMEQSTESTTAEDAVECELSVDASASGDGATQIQSFTQADALEVHTFHDASTTASVISTSKRVNHLSKKRKRLLKVNEPFSEGRQESRSQPRKTPGKSRRHMLGVYAFYLHVLNEELYQTCDSRRRLDGVRASRTLAPVASTPLGQLPLMFCDAAEYYSTWSAFATAEAVDILSKAYPRVRLAH